MSEDTPDDVVHDRAVRVAVPRAPPRPRDARHREDRSRRWPATRSPSSTASGTGRPTWSSSRPAICTTTRWSTDVDGCSSPTSRPVPAPIATPPVGDARAALRDRTGRPSRPTWPSAGGGCTTTTPTATPCGSPTRCSAAACRAGCSRRSARSAASPTPCSPRRRPTGLRVVVALRGYRADPPGRAARGHRRCDRRPRSPPASPTTSTRSRSATSRAPCCSGSRTPAAAWPASAAARSTRDEVISIDEHLGRIRAGHPRRRPPGAPEGPRFAALVRGRRTVRRCGCARLLTPDKQCTVGNFTDHPPAGRREA